MMKKGSIAGIGIGIAIVIIVAAYGLNSTNMADIQDKSEESVGFSDNVTPVLETAEPESEGKLLEVSVSDAISSEESP